MSFFALALIYCVESNSINGYEIGDSSKVDRFKSAIKNVGTDTFAISMKP